MKAVISVIGIDRIGILADVSVKCKEYNANIIDVSQTVLQNFFTMIMMVELESGNFLEFVDYLQDYGKETNLKIHVMHEDIFNAMHTI